MVTGASSGIGAATARMLRTRGWDVVAVARRAQRLRALQDETGAVAYAADLTVQPDVDALAAWLAETGPVHALVQVAGGARGTDRVEDASAADWQWMFDVNVLSAQRVVAALLPPRPTDTPTSSSSPRPQRRPPTPAGPATTLRRRRSGCSPARCDWS